MIEERQLEFSDIREGLVVYVNETAPSCLVRGRHCVNAFRCQDSLRFHLCCFCGHYSLHEHTDYTGLTTKLEIA